MVCRHGLVRKKRANNPHPERSHLNECDRATPELPSGPRLRDGLPLHRRRRGRESVRVQQTLELVDWRAAAAAQKKLRGADGEEAAGRRDDDADERRQEGAEEPHVRIAAASRGELRVNGGRFVRTHTMHKLQK